jgi:hypothetical protein
MPRRPKGDPYAAQYARYTPVARLICRVLIVFGLLLALDSQWTLTLAQEPVVSQNHYFVYGRRGSIVDSYYQIETPKTTFKSQVPYKEGQVLTLTRTAIFQQVMTHRTALAPVADTMDNWERTIYGLPQLVFIFLMWIAAIIGVWPGIVRRRTVDAAITACLFALINLYLLASF